MGLYQIRARTYNEAMKKARRKAIYVDEVVTSLSLDSRYYEQFGARDGTKLYNYITKKRRR